LERLLKRIIGPPSNVAKNCPAYAKYNSTCGLHMYSKKVFKKVEYIMISKLLKEWNVKNNNEHFPEFKHTVCGIWIHLLTCQAV